MLLTCFYGVISDTDGFQVAVLDFAGDSIVPLHVVGLGLVVWRGNGNNVRQFRGMRHAQGKQGGGGVTTRPRTLWACVTRPKQ